MRIFKNKPSISVSVTDDSTAVVIADGALKNVLQGRAPSTGIVIEQKVDCSISKSLKKDFIVDTFGDSPVQITLEGLTILNAACLGNGAGNGLTMEEFYEKYKLSANLSSRVVLGLSDGGKNGNSGKMFTCVLLGLQSSSTQNEARSGTIRYRLTLVGVAGK